MSKHLTERAMLCSLKFKHWGGAKIDRAVTAEVNRQHNARDDASTTRKFLVDTKSLHEIGSARSQIRKFHTTNTLPWGNDGTRILPTDQYWYYRENMSQLIDTHQRAVARFIEEVYPEQMQIARQRLGTMFDASEYPNVDELERLFDARYELWPMPDSQDFRAALSDEEANKIRKDMDATLNEKLAETTRELWERLHSVVQKAFDTFSDGDARFKKSTLTNISDIVALMPRLNITNDADLAAMTKQIATKLTNLDAEAIRNEPKARTEVARSADEILRQMSGYVGGINGT